MRRSHLVLLLAALLALGACEQSPPAAQRLPNVLLVTIDTLRADHLSCYGYSRATSPNLDRVAAEGWRFTHAQSPRAKTTPAIATLLSGLYPHEHGVRDLSGPLARPVPLLQEALTEAGYRTAGVVGNFVLTSARAGLDRGFEHWEETLPDVRGVPPHAAPQRVAASVTDGALELLAADDGRPWFLWLHYMDPHGAYAAPLEHRIFERTERDLIPREAALPHSALHRYRLADYNVPPSAYLLAAGGAPATRVDAAAVIDEYDAEIHYVDAEIGRLLEQLRGEGVLERTWVIVTSDHGESLGEHRYWFEHGAYAYEATCRVPLLVRPPAAEEAQPAVRTGDVSLADLAPTLLDLLGLAPLEGAGTDDSAYRGRSRSGLFRGVAQSGVPVFSEKVERAELDGAIQTKAVRMGDWKLIRRYAHRASKSEPGTRELVALSDELYDLGEDPREERNLAEVPPKGAPVEQLRAALLGFAAADVEFAELGEILQRRREALEREDAEALEVLRALGY